MRPSDLMPIEQIPDWEKRIERQDAFWQNEIIDRPVVTFAGWKANPDYPAPKSKQYANHHDRWFDAQYIAECALHNRMNTAFYGDALPFFNPNLGPEVLSAYMGMEMEFSEGTSWGIPNLKSWDDVDKLQFSKDNIYFQKILEITDACLEIGKGKFYTGQTDYHPGGDGVAAFRDPMELNIDMIDHPGEVKELVDKIKYVFFEVYDFFHDRITVKHNNAVTCWAGITSSTKWYVPSNDFSCMISKEMFDDVFLPEIIEECQHLEASIYHLDGPDALKHLDSLLAIKELNAIQWVYGAGNGRATDWLDVYKKCQAAGKGIQLYADLDELDTIIENLKPNGVWLGVKGGGKDQDQANAVLKKIEKWR